MSGVLAVNGIALVVGFCVLAPALRGLRPLIWATWAGLALLVGVALVGLGLFIAAIAGAAAGPWTFAVVSVVLVLVAMAATALLPQRRLRAPVAPPRPRPPWLADAAATAAAAALGVLALALLVGGFRSSPWLDDAWGIWLPKGIALSRLGLDERLFIANGTYVHFEVPDYPLWWSALVGLDVRVAAELDVRAMNAQLALLAVAFGAAVPRLLWGWVRPWLLWGGVLLIVASPAFLHHAQSGMADLPLAIYVSLALLAGVGWVVTGSGFHLALVVMFGSAAAAIKTEGLPEVLLVLVLVGIFAPRRRVGLWLAGVAVALSAVPWLVWRASHDVGGRTSLGHGLDPGFLADRADRLGPGAQGLVRHLLDPTEWLLVVPIALLLAVVGFAVERRAAWLGLPTLLAAGLLLLTWAYWADRDDIGYLVATSAYRVVDPLVLISALAIPLLAERLLSVTRALPARGSTVTP